MFDFCKRMFIDLLSVCASGRFCEPLSSNSKGRLKFIFLSNQPCQTRPTLFDINSNDTLFYQFTVSVNKYCESCNMIYMLKFLFQIKRKI